MTVTVEEDFREFVAARWGELESVARLVTLDGPTARRVTTDALTDLHGQWGRLLDEGSPGAAARRVVVAGSVAAAGRGPTSGSPPGTDHGADLGDGAPDDPAVVALLPVLRGATALERAVLAAASVWGLDPGAVADLLGMPPAPVRDADLAVRRRLLTAHTAARAGAGWEPAEWALERDLDDALDLLAPGAAEPPDAVALVAERHRQVRRRSVVIGAGAALAVGAVASLGVDAVMTGASTQAAPLPPGPGDPVWAMTRDWPARGRLATDAGVLALVASASPRAHLLYADDLAGQRVVVAATADASGAGGTLVRMWTGPRGAAAGTLTSANLVRDRVVFTDDVVPVAIEAGPDDADGAGAVLLLARPTVLEAQVSPVVSYARSGEVGRRWAEVALRDGVATVPLRGPLPPAFRVRLDGYDAGPLGVTSLGLPVPDDPATPLAAGLLDALGPFVAACTGLPESAVRSTVVLDVPVAGDVLAPLGQAPGRGRVVVAQHPGAERRPPAHGARHRRRSQGRRPARRRDHPAGRPGHGVGPARRPAPGVRVERQPVPGHRARCRSRPAGRHVDQHLPRLEGDRAAQRHGGARGGRRPPGRRLRAHHLGPPRAPARLRRDLLPPAGPARPLAPGALSTPDPPRLPGVGEGGGSAALVGDRGRGGRGGLRVEVLAGPGRHEVGAEPVDERHPRGDVQAGDVVVADAVEVLDQRAQRVAVGRDEDRCARR